jgi:hypothetical protein
MCPSILLTLLILLTLSTPVHSATINNERPDWTERSSFTFADELYAVGIASHAASVEEGRQQAFENGKKELQNFAQIPSLHGVAIGTPRIYEERNADGTFTVFRLLKAALSELKSIAVSPKSIPQGNKNSPSYTADGLWRYAPWIEEECLRDKHGNPRDNKWDQISCHWEIKAKIAEAEDRARPENSERQLAQANPEEYARMNTLRNATRRVEKEKQEKKQVCGRLQRGVYKGGG